MRPAILETPRLVLRPLEDSDGDALAAMHADAQVMRHFPATMTRAQTHGLIQRLQERERLTGIALRAVVLRDSGEVAGLAGLNRPSFEAAFTPCVEIGWRFARRFWGQGYATEAAEAALGYGFHDLALQEIVAFTVPANTASRAVMDRLGMTHMLDFDHPMIAEGHALRRHVFYRLRKDDWTARTARPGL
jgi:RimJ/RimL family protein N-acetyltransferase